MTCIGKDPRCPCQDGDACHYKDCGGTKAWPVPKAEPVDCWDIGEDNPDSLAKHSAFRATQEQQAEPVVQAVIVGALFDFMGWLTTRKERLVLSSTDNASPAVESITEFAKMRGLSLADARVQDWQNYTTQQQAEPTCPDCKAAVLYECVACSSNNYPPKQQAEPVADDMAEQLADALDSAQFYRRRVDALQSWQSKMRDPERIIICDILANGHTLDPAFAGDRYTAPPQRQWVGLTDEEIRAVNAQVSRIPPIDYTTCTYARAVETKLKEKNT